MLWRKNIRECCNLEWCVREGIIEKVAVRKEDKEIGVLISGRGASQLICMVCKGPETHVCLGGLRSRKTLRVAEAEGAKGNHSRKWLES